MVWVHTHGLMRSFQHPLVTIGFGVHPGSRVSCVPASAFGLSSTATSRGASQFTRLES